MEIITNEQIYNYKRVLDLENVEDIETVTQKLNIALADYFYNDLENITKLNLIVEAYLKIMNIKVTVFDMSELVKLGESIHKKDKNDEFSTFEELYIIYFNLMVKLFLKNNNDKELKDRARVMYKLACIIQYLYNYEKTKNGSQKTKSTN